MLCPVKKLLTFLGLAIVGVVGLCVMIGLGKGAAYRDNRMKCDTPLGPSATRELSLGLPDGVKVCRKTDRPDSADLELLVETPSALCFASVGQIGCPSLVNNQVAFMSAMGDAGWDVGDALQNELRFSRGKGESASVRLRISPFGEVAATMTVYLPSSKVGKQ
jgi:hypothetical protein